MECNGGPINGRRYEDYYRNRGGLQKNLTTNEQQNLKLALLS